MNTGSCGRRRSRMDEHPGKISLGKWRPAVEMTCKNMPEIGGNRKPEINHIVKERGHL